MTRVISGVFQFPGMDGQPHPQQLMSVPEFVARPQNMMGFADAVRSAIVNNYVNFSGRASRSEYWWFALFNMVIAIGSFPIDVALGYDFTDPYSTPWVSNLFSLLLLLPGLGLSVRRLHDTGRSGWMLLIGIIPCIGLILLIVWCVEEGNAHVNAYGDVPTNTIE